MHSARLAGLVLAVFLAAFCTACSPKLDWREFRAGDGGFTVLLPQKPGQAEHSFVTPLGRITMKMYSVRIDETVLGAGYADFAGPVDAHALDLMRDALVRGLKGTLTSERPVVAGTLSGREINITGAIGEGGKAAQVDMRARLYGRDKRYFQLVLAGKKGAFAAVDADMFFDSFHVN